MAGLTDLYISKRKDLMARNTSAPVTRDAENNIIQPQQKPSDEYQVLMAKEIKYLCFGHPGVQDWRTDEAGTWGGTQAAAGSPGKWYQGGSKHNTYLNGISANYLPPAFDPDDILPEASFHSPNFNYKKREVSSFSATVGETGSYAGGFPLHQYGQGNIR